LKILDVTETLHEAVKLLLFKRAFYKDGIIARENEIKAGGMGNGMRSSSSKYTRESHFLLPSQLLKVGSTCGTQQLLKKLRVL
jgi:hypothetical protein